MCSNIQVAITEYVYYSAMFSGDEVSLQHNVTAGVVIDTLAIVKYLRDL